MQELTERSVSGCASGCTQCNDMIMRCGHVRMLCVYVRMRLVIVRYVECTKFELNTVLD